MKIIFGFLKQANRPKISYMKKIVLAHTWPRIFAAFIDFLIEAAVFALIFFAAVYPNSLDKNAYIANQDAIKRSYSDSGLFVENSNDLVSPTSLYDYSLVKDINSVNFTSYGESYSVSLIKNLYVFYTAKAASYDTATVTRQIFESDILKIGSVTSNIASFTADEAKDTYAIAMIEETAEKRDITVSFVLSLYNSTITKVSSSKTIVALDEANKTLMRNSLLLMIPTFFGVSLIFELIIPLCSPNGKTIGKWIFHLVVLDKYGYELKRIWLLPRFLAYSIIEGMGGIASFGATFLISYTMFMFTKKHRSFHDYCGNSIVADERESLWFLDRAEEEDYVKNHPELAR
jgi:uncharacterized RDD family membrane protein YckC